MTSTAVQITVSLLASLVLIAGCSDPRDKTEGTPRALATYSGLSVKTLRNYIDKLPDEALPAYRVGGKILVRRSEFDQWISAYRAVGRPGVARAIRDLGLGKV